MVTARGAVEPPPGVAAVPLDKRSRFGAKLARRELVTTVEIVTPRGNTTLVGMTVNQLGTIRANSALYENGSIYLTTGTKLFSNELNVLAEITADTCGRHDTLGGACSCEANTIRYGHGTRHMHSCRQSFLLGLATWPHATGFDLNKRDIPANINFFMNVPVTPEGGLQFADGVSSPGKYVEMVARMDIVCLLSNCPQLNNPCNGWNPTPVEVLIWNP